MINRRHIRVKVMQSLYAIQKTKSIDIQKEEKFLKNSVQKMFHLYALSLRLIVEVQKLAVLKLELSKKKHLATKEDLSPNQKFINNSCIHQLEKSSSLQSYLEIHRLDQWKTDDEYTKIILDTLQKSELYQRYMESDDSSFAEDKAFIASFFKEIIAPNEKLADYFEDHLITWSDDIPFVNTLILKSLSKLKLGKEFTLGKLYKDEDDEQFVLDLFRKTVLKGSEYDKEIEHKTPNWETDRIAHIDLILIKMAISEFLFFPSIPNRVTINEYIEISKDYSTEKSSYFINGVLDKLSKEFIQDKRSVKIGRGLL